MRAVGKTRVDRAEKNGANDTEEGRIQIRQEQQHALDILAGSSSPYGRGIDDSV